MNDKMAVPKIASTWFRAASLGVMLAGASLVVAGCQSSKGGAGDQLSGPMTPGAAQAAYYECIDSASRGRVRGGGGPQVIAGRFINRCSGSLADWEEALIASGMPPAEAAELTDNVRDNLRDEFAESLRPVA